MVKVHTGCARKCKEFYPFYFDCLINCIKEQTRENNNKGDA